MPTATVAMSMSTYGWARRPPVAFAFGLDKSQRSLAVLGMTRLPGLAQCAHQELVSSRAERGISPPHATGGQRLFLLPHSLASSGRERSASAPDGRAAFLSLIQATMSLATVGPSLSRSSM